MYKKIMMMSMVLGAAACLVAAPQPAAHWKLDEGSGTTIKDSTGKAPDGKVLNEANTAWGEGREGGKALIFKGDPEKDRKGGTVRLPIEGVYDPSKPFTISCWVKPASEEKMPGPTNYELISNTISDNGPGFRLLLSWNEASFMCWDGTPRSGFDLRAKSSKFPMERESWIHLAATFDGKGAKLYVNGALADQTPADTEFKATKGHDYFSVASYNLGYAYSYQGAISDIKLFNQALTPAEVMAEAKGIELE